MTHPVYVRFLVTSKLTSKRRNELKRKSKKFLLEAFVF